MNKVKLDALVRNSLCITRKVLARVAPEIFSSLELIFATVPDTFLAES